MRNTDTNKFVAALAIIATPFALGAFMLAWSPAVQYGLEDPKRDGYVQPRSVTDLVEKASRLMNVNAKGDFVNENKTQNKLTKKSP